MSDYKDEIDRLNRELQEVKKKFYDQKKREMIQQDQFWARDSWELYVGPVWVLVVKKKNHLGMRMRKTWILLDPKSSNHPVEMRSIARSPTALFATNFSATPPDKTIKTPAIFEGGSMKTGLG